MAGDKTYPTDSAWQPVDISKLCKPFTQTPSGDSNARMGNKAAALKTLARATNKLASRFVRPTFWQAQPSTSATTHLMDSDGSAPLYVSRYLDGVPNARRTTTRILTMPRTESSNATNCWAELQGNVDVNTGLQNANADLNMFETYYQLDWTHVRGASSNAMKNVGISTYNGFRVLDVVYQDEPIDPLKNWHDDGVDESLANPKQPVLADISERIRSSLHHIRTRNLPVVTQWHAYGAAGSFRFPSASTESGAWCNSVTNVNLINSDWTDVNSDSPGFVVPLHHCGKGLSDTVTVQCSVYGRVKASGDEFDVTFASRYSNATVMFDNHVDDEWRDANITLVSNVSDTASNSDMVKVDILGAVRAAGDEGGAFAITAEVVDA